MKKTFIGFISILFFCVSFVQAKELSLSRFASYQEQTEVLEEQRDLSKLLDHFQKRRCVWYDRGTYFAVSPACFLQEDAHLPLLSFSDTVDLIMPYIADVSDIYDTFSSTFSYRGTSLLWKQSFPHIEDLFRAKDIFLLRLLGHYNILIRIPKIFLAYEQVANYSFYASMRETADTYNECRKQNYDIAMQALDRVLLESGEELNMNTLIANKPGYCEGSAGKFLFYQGVCGASTQLFWNGLINPYLLIKERSPHGEFRTSFYGHMGEDAAIYEMSKQLILENTGQYPLYFRTFVRESDGNTVLLSVYPQQNDLISIVEKKDLGDLQAELKNTIVNSWGDVLYEKVWESRYWGVNKTED